MRDGKRKMAGGASFISKREASADDTSRTKETEFPAGKGRRKMAALARLEPRTSADNNKVLIKRPVKRSRSVNSGC